MAKKKKKQKPQMMSKEERNEKTENSILNIAIGIVAFSLIVLIGAIVYTEESEEEGPPPTEEKKKFVKAPIKKPTATDLDEDDDEDGADEGDDDESVEGAEEGEEDLVEEEEEVVEEVKKKPEGSVMDRPTKGIGWLSTDTQNELRVLIKTASDPLAAYPEVKEARKQLKRKKWKSMPMLLDRFRKLDIGNDAVDWKTEGQMIFQAMEDIAKIAKKDKNFKFDAQTATVDGSKFKVKKWLIWWDEEADNHKDDIQN